MAEGMLRRAGSDGPWKQAGRRFAKNKLALACVFLLAGIVLLCILAPYIAPYDYAKISLAEAKCPPSAAHLFGTDGLGRDILSRLLYGGRITFRISIGAVVLSLLGLFFGLAAGYCGGWVDQIIARATDALASIPTFLLVILFECMMGWGKGNYMYAMALAFMPPLVRLSRGLVLNIMGSEYIEASRALGVSGIKIVSHHVLRNIAAPVVVHVSSSLAESLLTCTVMS